MEAGPEEEEEEEEEEQLGKVSENHLLNLICVGARTYGISRFGVIPNCKCTPQVRIL